MSKSAAGQPKPIWKGTIGELDGLRGIAIFLVFLYHWWPTRDTLSRSWQYASMGWIGVDLFFVISGFLICGILLDTRGEVHYFRNFYARRTLRIFPLYYAFLLIVFTVIPFVQGGPYFQTPFLKEAGSPAWYFLYLTNFAVILRDRPYFLGLLWTLAIEEQFYICFPFLVAVLAPNRLWKLLIGVIIAAPVFRIVTMLTLPGIGLQILATPARIDDIAMGALLAVGLRSGRFRCRPGQATALLIGTLAVAIAAFYAGWFDKNLPCGRTIGLTIIGATFFSTLLWTLLHRDRAVTAFLCFQPLQYLGKICYGSYMLHLVAGCLLLKILGRLGMTVNPESSLLFVGKVGATVALASLSWFLFERPILKLKDRFTSSHHPGTTATLPAPEAIKGS